MRIIVKMLRALLGFNRLQRQIEEGQEALLLATGTLLDRNNAKKDKLSELSDAEFKIFSQWGDDGIISWIFHKLNCPSPFFIEFGVQNYRESNTRFMLLNKNWSGLVIDGNPDFIDYIKNDPIYWRHSLNALNLFITKDNIDDFLKKHCPKKDVELLSIDIDGNDYWIFESIKSLSPKIIICEFNSLFGEKAEISTPYKEDFVRGTAHYSHLYFGSSIQALITLAKTKGYSFLGTNRNGNNAYFARNDIFQSLGGLIERYTIHPALFRESRDIQGQLNYLDQEQGRKHIGHLPVINLKTGKMTPLNEITL